MRPKPGACCVWCVLFLFGCTSLRQYRCDYPGSPAMTYAARIEGTQPRDAMQIRADCSPAIETRGRTFLGFVEFDDVGAPWDVGQRDFILTELGKRLSKEPHIVVIFVHGWNHNAGRCDENVACFRNVLEYLDKLENLRFQARGEGKPWPVAGIYVGWRGAAYGQAAPSSFYNWTSFWGRKSTAHAVGAAGGVADLLASIEAMAKPVPAEGPSPLLEDPTPRSRLITVGHSFGGAVTFDAVAQVLIERSVAKHRAARFGDLVVLVNPAFEATRAELFRARPLPSGGAVVAGQPGLVIFASKKDRANRTLFPMGRFLSSFLKRHRPSRNALLRAIDQQGKDQGVRARTAIGHYKPWRDYELVPGSAAQNDSRTAMPSGKCGCPFPTPRIDVEGMLAQTAQPSGGLRLGGSTLRPIHPGQPGTGVDIVSVDGAIIPTHSSIYTQAFVEALVAYMVTSYSALPP